MKTWEDTDPTSDFVKKLFKVLEDGRDSHIISWSRDGHFFIVKDVNVFTKEILPRLFRHSNFASFVRQLNKYDFRKVRSIDVDNGELGEESPAFKHPHFKANCKANLVSILRQPSNRKESTASGFAETNNGSLSSPIQEVASPTSGFHTLQLQIKSLHEGHQLLSEGVQRIDGKYDDLVSALSGLQDDFGRQRNLVQTLLKVLVKSNNDGPFAAAPSCDHNTPVLLPSSASASRASDIENDFPNTPKFNFLDPVGLRTLSVGDRSSLGIAEPVPQEKELPATSLSYAAPASTASHLHPPSPPSTQWVLPPHILIVDDDDITRKVLERFLQQSGCTVDVAMDGLDGLTKFSGRRYDLVLMDIGMPNLDGLSATSFIRRNGDRTPIISITSNSAPRDVWGYFEGGMNDCLPKPVIKDELLKVLEKYLSHLRISEAVEFCHTTAAATELIVYSPASDGPHNFQVDCYTPSAAVSRRSNLPSFDEPVELRVQSLRNGHKRIHSFGALEESADSRPTKRTCFDA